jgi:hypothetical protein
MRAQASVIRLVKLFKNCAHVDLEGSDQKISNTSLDPIGKADGSGFKGGDIIGLAS